MKRAGTLVLDMSNRAENAAHPVPLTPALSLGERENRSQLLLTSRHQGFSKCDSRRKVFALLQDGLRLFPLPEGEGQGEGERGFRRLSRAMFSAVASV